ncbi:MAG: T9SS type A sorting domain-containing protein [Bacteroidia bacterium]
MKKQLLTISAILSAAAAFAQNDTLLFSNFNTDPSVYMQVGTFPPGVLGDTSWYSYDLDQLPDGSSSGRPGEWFWTVPFSDNDTIAQGSCMGSNSWTNDGFTPISNWMILSSIQIIDANATLYWMSAPRQTPRYLDGYKILVSTTQNDLNNFTDTLFVASEFVSLNNQNAPFDFSSYTFNPSATANPLAPFVHGMDSTFTEFDPASDSSRLIGRLRPFSVSLAQYSGQSIYIAFVHDCIDDNLTSIDDIRVMGTSPNSIKENDMDFGLSVYPNPSSDLMNVKFELASAGKVSVELFDMSGRLVRTESFGTQGIGVQSRPISVSGLATGIYHLKLQTEQGVSNISIVVQ